MSNTPTATSVQALSLDELRTYYAPPPPVPPTVQPSTDPNVFMNDPNYMKGLNKQFFEQFLVVVPNDHEFDRWNFDLQNWAGAPGGYRKAALPLPPHYKQLNNTKFDAWWMKYCDTYGKTDEPPAVDFIDNVPSLPDPIIVAPPPPPTSGSPIGDPNGANIFRSSGSDSFTRFQDNSVYTDQTGTYVKHIYITPFGTTIFWYKVA